MRPETLVALRWLLEHHDDLTAAATPESTRGRTGSHVPLPPHQPFCNLMRPDSDRLSCSCWLRYITELDRLLRVMRDHGHEIRRVTLPGGQTARVSVRGLWWHVTAFYRDSRRVPTFTPAPLKRGKKPPRIKEQEILRDPESGRWAATVIGERRQVHPNASRLMADAGLLWMGEHWRGARPMLPAELLAA